MKKLTKIQKSAKGEECTVMVEGCNPGPENETVVFAHAPRHHRGGMRDNDTWGAYCCANCHDKLDGRARWDGDRGRVSYGDEIAISSQILYEKLEAWFYAIEKTQAKLKAKGLMTVVK